MLRVVGCALLCVAAGCAERRLPLTAVPVGTSIRVTPVGAEPLTGRLLAPPDSMLTYGSGGVALSTPLSAIHRIEIRDHAARRGLLKGAILGGVVASTAWMARAKVRCEPAVCGDTFSASIGTLLGAALQAAPIGIAYGAVTGAVMGAFSGGWSKVRW